MTEFKLQQTVESLGAQTLLHEAGGRKWLFAKKTRNAVKHVALLFVQNSVPGDAEHIAGPSDLPRNLEEGSFNSNTRALPQTVLQLRLSSAS